MAKLILDDTTQKTLACDRLIDLDPSKTYIIKDGKCYELPKSKIREQDAYTHRIDNCFIESLSEVKS